jgi:predicted ATP-dependent serine protease
MWSEAFYNILNDLTNERYAIDDDLTELKELYIERVKNEINNEVEQSCCIDSINSIVGDFYADM